MSPRTLFARFAFAEAVTWTLLIIGMVLKYVTHTTELGVRVFGLLHGVVFLGYVLVTLAVWVNQRWSTSTGLLALASAVPPYATVWFERRAIRRGQLEGEWRVGPGQAPARTLPERVLATAIARPALAATVGVVAVLAMTGVLLLIGPPPVPGART